MPRLPASSVRVRFHEMDDYSFASEVALHLLSVEFGVTLDGILCDPAIAESFDKLADCYSPTRHTPREYRWAALTLRKRAKDAKRLAPRFEQWLTSRLPKAQPLAQLVPSQQNVPGVYTLVSRDQRELYVGETYDLGKKLEQIRGTAAWMELRPESVRIFAGQGRGLSGLKSVLIQRVNPRLNSFLLFPRLEPTG